MTACDSCDKKGKCPYINWDKKTDNIKVIGCSGHPDQVKYKGHSVTVEITASLAGRNYTNVNTTWATNYDKTTAENQTTTATSCGISVDTVNGYTFYRPFFLFDMSAIPSSAISLSGYFSIYLGARTDGAEHYKLCGLHATRPTGDVSDYNRTYYTLIGTSTWTTSDFTINSYNNITVTELSAFRPGSTARMIGRGEKDYNNTPPGLVPPPNLFFTGGVAPNAPKINYTYSLGGNVNNSMFVKAGRWI